LGVQLALAGGDLKLEVPPAATVVDKPALFPVTRLYDQGTTLLPSALLRQRLAGKVVQMNARTAGQLGASAGAGEFVLDGKTLHAQVTIDETLPDGIVMIPRSVGIY
jgi:hypothetical protein